MRPLAEIDGRLAGELLLTRIVEAPRDEEVAIRHRGIEVSAETIGDPPAERGREQTGGCITVRRVDDEESAASVRRGSGGEIAGAGHPVEVRERRRLQRLFARSP